ncbi:MAG: methionine aminotransferase [Bacteroidia bacterium]
MSELAVKHNAINLSQGFPDFQPDKKLMALVAEGMKKGYNQYANMPGLLPLREIISEKTKSLYGSVYNPADEITVVPGGTYGIFVSIMATIRDGDEVIIFEPAYDCYVPAIELSGGKPIRLELKFPDYHIDWREVAKLVNFKTKMIILNTPHNPTGTVLTEEDIKQLEKIVHGSDIIILSDEVYEHIIFDHKKHLSVSQYSALAERSMIVSSFGKTYHTTGWKMGYVLAPENLTKELRKVHQFLVFSTSSPMQYAYAEMLKNPETYNQLPSFYQQKRDLFASHLAGSRFKLLPCSGSYFQLLDYSNISDEKDEDFAKRLTIEYGVASIPISVFYRNKTDNKVLRFCFAKSPETLQNAAEILCKI